MITDRVARWRKDAREVDEKGNAIMTVPYIKQLCKEQKLYQTPELNDRLYLHFKGMSFYSNNPVINLYKGFQKIQNLETYTGLKTLWLEGNGINKLENLNSCVELRCLFLQQNCISEIENISSLVHLDTLNLSNNLLKEIKNLRDLPNLKTLQVDRNFLKTYEDIEELQHCKSLTVVDLSFNKLDDPRIIEIFEKMPNLAVLNLQSNPVIKLISNYRRKMIYEVKSLTYLDDRPVFDNERLAVNAFMEGGAEAEREERMRQKQHELDEHTRSFEALRKLQARNKESRIQSQGGVEEEPVFSAPLERFRQEQMQKIADFDAKEEKIEDGLVASGTLQNDGIAASAEADVFSDQNTQKHDGDMLLSSASLLDEVDLDSDEEGLQNDQPPIRHFSSITTKGEKPTDVEEEIEKLENDALEKPTESPKQLIEEIGAAAYNKSVIPSLEDASYEVDAMRERRRAFLQESKNVKEDNEEELETILAESRTNKNLADDKFSKQEENSCYKIVPDEEDLDDEMILPLLGNASSDVLSDLQYKDVTVNSLKEKNNGSEEDKEDNYSTIISDGNSKGLDDIVKEPISLTKNSKNITKDGVLKASWGLLKAVNEDLGED
ncbi:Dynein assembly factor 1, axonemal [Lobulomyces angularis]|nr:Dynein assembly factor 1, axonemal [Lobulomyces angularis]